MKIKQWFQLDLLKDRNKMDTARCLNCSLFCGEQYETGYYQLKDNIYCSINCFTEFTKKEMEKALNGRPKEKSRNRSKSIKKRRKRRISPSL